MVRHHKTIITSVISIVDIIGQKLINYALQYGHAGIALPGHGIAVSNQQKFELCK